MAKFTLEQLKNKTDNLKPLLSQIGTAVIVPDVQETIRSQTFNEKPWPKRYPNQSGAKVNVAGIIGDFTQGRNPLQKRFVDSPVLQSLEFIGSFTSRVVGADSVQVGTTWPFANIHHFGLASFQNITQTTRDNLSKFLKKERKKSKERGKELSERLGFIFNTEVLETNVVERRFLFDEQGSLQKKTTKDIFSFVKRFFEKP